MNRLQKGIVRETDAVLGYWEPLGAAYGVWVNSIYGFTTDTLLLAQFSAPAAGEICADFGTGCGTIPILWQLLGKPKKVYGIELQQAAVSQAQAAVVKNKLQDRIEILPGDIRCYKTLLPHQSLHRIACNPPYKAMGAGLQNNRQAQKIARHEACLTPAEIAAAAVYTLRFGGKLCICQRPERLADFVSTFRAFHLEPKRLQFVQKDGESAPSLFLLESCRGGRPGMQVAPALLLSNWKGYENSLGK